MRWWPEQGGVIGRIFGRGCGRDLKSDGLQGNVGKIIFCLAIILTDLRSRSSTYFECACEVKGGEMLFSYIFLALFSLATCTNSVTFLSIK